MGATRSAFPLALFCVAGFFLSTSPAAVAADETPEATESPNTIGVIFSSGVTGDLRRLTARAQHLAGIEPTPAHGILGRAMQDAAVGTAFMTGVSAASLTATGTQIRPDLRPFLTQPERVATQLSRAGAETRDIAALLTREEAAQLKRLPEGVDSLKLGPVVLLWNENELYDRLRRGIDPFEQKLQAAVESAIQRHVPEGSGRGAALGLARIAVRNFVSVRTLELVSRAARQYRDTHPEATQAMADRADQLATKSAELIRQSASYLEAHPLLAKQARAMLAETYSLTAKKPKASSPQETPPQVGEKKPDEANHG